MLKISELAMPRSRKVTTVCNGKREVWVDYEETKAFFPEHMMSVEAKSVTTIVGHISRTNFISANIDNRKKT